MTGDYQAEVLARIYAFLIDRYSDENRGETVEGHNPPDADGRSANRGEHHEEGQ